jgi:hypothetical protein
MQASRSAKADRGATRMKAPHVTAQITRELYIAMERLGARPELPSIIGSWCDTLTDAEILALLRVHDAAEALRRSQ